MSTAATDSSSPSADAGVKSRTRGGGRSRKAIIDAATATFLRQGYRHASMNAIAREAGVSKQTVYNQFGSKDLLFGAVVRQQCEHLVNLLEAPQSAGLDIRTMLKNVGLKHLELLLNPDSVALFRTLIAEAQHFPELGRLSWELGPRHAEAALARYLKAQAEANQINISDPERAAEQFLGMVKGSALVRSLLGVEEGMSRRERLVYLEHTVDRFLGTLDAEANSG